MEDCSVCYTNEPRCKLVCGHAFCYQCVKNWYQKSDEPSCPMCRGSLYFRNMRCHIDKWEDERVEAHNQECFNNVLETFFDEEELEFYGTEDIMWEIEELQKRYHQFIDSGYDMEDILNADEEDIIISGGYPAILDDMFNKNLFITKHKTQRRMMRNGKRVMGKRDSSLGLELVILRIEA
jgi:hypothetical protein